MAMDRRTFLQLLSSGAFAAAVPASIGRALELPANNRTGTIADVEHIVILMQENRSFDHYFGTLRGARGFGDPRVARFPSGDPVWYQPNGSGYLLPFHPDQPDLGLDFLEDTPHDWTSTHAGWNQGKLDQWVPNKGTTSMAYLKRKDIPFHYALADAFTICDAYHCSLLGPTDPNRYHMWTGWVGNDGSGGGPVIDNAEAGYGWSTYPELLQKAGVSWKIYQDVGAGLNAAQYWGWGPNAFIGNYGDNSLLYFFQYQNSLPGSPLYEGALTGTDVLNGGTLFDVFRADIVANRLPQVSWIVAPEAYCEHGNWPSNYGAWYVSQMLDALTANPEVWSKTAFFLCFDENDGFFDHIVPPTPPQTRAQGISNVDITNEIFPGNATYESGPYGLGMRVPMIVISPWSKGGWVNSEVFDHTSLIRFIETRFGPQYPGIKETNITKWRRAVTGDLTSAFDFRTPNAKVVSLPDTSSYAPTVFTRQPSYVPVPPTDQAMPVQEPGIRPARAVPYELNVLGAVNFSTGSVKIHFANDGRSAAVFHVRSGNNQNGPWTYTVAGKTSLSDTWAIAAGGQSAYDLSVYGPNGFLRAFKGKISGQGSANLEIQSSYGNGGSSIALSIRNAGSASGKVTILNAYTGHSISQELKPGQSFSESWNLEKFFGWYDLVVTIDSDSGFRQQLAGHVESGKDSMTDPAIAAFAQDV